MKHKKLLIGVSALAGSYFIARNIAGDHTGDEHINDDNPYIPPMSALSDAEKETLYLSVVKPALDRILSFTGLIVLAPVFGVIALAVFADDPGPVIFTQKRIGKNKIF